MAFMSVPTKAILMYRAPFEGQVKKRLAESIGDAAALSIYRWMGQRQLEAIPAAWSVEVRFTPDWAKDAMVSWLGPGPRYVAQERGDLGERMWRATRASLAGENPSKLIFLGADCLALDETLLARASEHLGEKDFVVGPAFDGGYYLLGMRVCESLVFENVSWGASTVFAETVGAIESLGGSIEILDTLRDIDDWDSLKGEKGRIAPDIRRELRLD